MVMYNSPIINYVNIYDEYFNEEEDTMSINDLTLNNNVGHLNPKVVNNEEHRNNINELHYVEYENSILLQYKCYYKQINKDETILNYLKQHKYQEIINTYFPDNYINIKSKTILINNKKYVKIQEYIFPIKCENFVLTCLAHGMYIKQIYHIYAKVMESNNKDLIDNLLYNDFYKIRNDYLSFYDNNEYVLLDKTFISYSAEDKIKFKYQQSKNFDFLNKLKKPHYKKCKLCGNELIYNEKSEYCHNCELGIGIKKYNLSDFQRK